VKNRSQLFLALLMIFVGMTAIIKRHIGSATILEKQANGPAAIFVGVCLLIIATYMLVTWIKENKDGSS
jgi:uncharacterized membrane protein